MRTYRPDRWVVVKIDLEKEPLYKVFGSWSGGYLYGDSWRLNSGVERISEKEDSILFHGYTGSVYECHKDSYGYAEFSRGILDSLIYESGLPMTVLTEEQAKEWIPTLG